MHKKHFVVYTKERNTVFYAQETLCCLGRRKKHCFLCTRNTLLSWQKKETLFSMHKKHFVVSAKERNTVSYAQETLCCLGKGKKHCFLYIRNTLLSQQKKEILFPMHKKHFVVLAKERNTVSCAQETLCCLGKRKRTLFPMYKKHFVVLAKEENTVFYAQEILCCLSKRKKHCFLYIRNTLLS